MSQEVKNIKVSGAKNSATRLLAAAALSDKEILLKNFPTKLVDAGHKADFLEKSGANIITNHKESSLKIKSEGLSNRVTEFNFPIRTTYLLAASLLKREGCAKIPYPGGCKIGQRGYDLHIMVWERLGCTVEEYADYILITSPGKLKGNSISFPISTVGGTENALITASIAEGETEIFNAYVSPEVNDLIRFLTAMGVSIEVIGNSYIKVKGTTEFRATTYNVMPDRIEALTWLVFGVLSGLSLKIDDVPFDIMEIPLKHINEAGIDFFRNNKSIYVSPECLNLGEIQPFELACGTHPGVISDMQPFYVLLALKAKGISRIYDYRYPERTAYLDELNKLCGNAISYEPGKIVINGPAKFSSHPIVYSKDLRGSMAVVLAALLAEDTAKTEIKDFQMALRGYNNLLDKLEQIGIELEANDNTVII
ncbi:UDP-N-acetylglucosamine 1-carboxyvinyltransferase [Pontibacter lucknowensis]|uniref:UDP-N-acetylglucosamine 1-carboxyvinyltransferase n=1 Tax=Pontibacter lucknowensis TaxID=1077936 RepID=A0A1N6Y747_9BACT|nr:UDP-N-acetylglucosamine 1-carboxyvinyltransferase [Pontibacter lucknowensis]SIR10374.1 UDP-N-acetylglucosamine 1-carboxyvinyltransferase [Pontibacter lucknowensis]